MMEERYHATTQNRFYPDISNVNKNIGCPTLYRTRQFFNNFTTNEDIATKQTHTTDTFLFIPHTTNLLLFKFRYNIFIGVRIIKEMPGSVASGTPYVTVGHPMLQWDTLCYSGGKTYQPTYVISQ
jgi:hypothetical protein